MTFLDFETRSLAELKEVGEWVYSLDPSTLILCMAYSYSEDPGTVHIYAPWHNNLDVARKGLIVPTTPEPDAELIELFRRIGEGERLCAHSASFEQDIWRNVAARRWGWPSVPDKQWVCSMAAARAYGLPGGLDLAAKTLGGIPAKGSQEAMRRTMRPRTTWKSKGAGDPWFLTPEDYQELCEYCQQDVVVEYAIWERLPKLTPREQQLFYLDAEMNTRGVPVDKDLARGAWALFADRRAKGAAQLSTLTKNAVETPTQTARIAAWVTSQGVDMPNCQAATVTALLACDLPGDVRKVLEVRQAVGGAAALKYAAFIRHENGGRVRGEIQYYGSHTGRYTSSGVQLHNAVKNKMDVDEAETRIPCFYHDDAETVAAALAAAGVDDKQIDALLATLVRSVIHAPPGHTFIDVDYASIEARVMAWLAGEVALLRQFREFDRTQDPNLEPYRIAAADLLGIAPADVGKKERAFGKILILAPQYGMGPAKFLEQCHSWGMTWVDEALAGRAIRSYRAKYWRTKKYWYDLEAAIRRAMAMGKAWHYQVPIVYDRAREILGVGLPNGRWLWYHQCKIVNDKIQYFGRLPPPKSGYGTVYSWGGKFAENVDQGLSRDYMAAGMIGVDAIPGVELCLTIHDELLMIIKEADVDRLLPLIEKAVTPRPLWARGLPIDIGYWVGPRFRKD